MSKKYVTNQLAFLYFLLMNVYSFIENTMLVPRGKVTETITHNTSHEYQLTLLEILTLANKSLSLC